VTAKKTLRKIGQKHFNVHPAQKYIFVKNERSNQNHMLCEKKNKKTGIYMNLVTRTFWALIIHAFIMVAVLH